MLRCLCVVICVHYGGLRHVGRFIYQPVILGLGRVGYNVCYDLMRPHKTVIWWLQIIPRNRGFLCFYWFRTSYPKVIQIVVIQITNLSPREREGPLSPRERALSRARKYPICIQLY
jgi:hypothetical protein